MGPFCITTVPGRCYCVGGALFVLPDLVAAGVLDNLAIHHSQIYHIVFVFDCRYANLSLSATYAIGKALSVSSFGLGNRTMLVPSFLWINL